jgi:predicted ATP-grasp superfamily ATP-dependent carboligase
MTLSSQPKRLLILSSKFGYQTKAFAEAASRVGAEVLFGTDRCGRLDDPWGDAALPLHFDDPEESAEKIAHLSAKSPIGAILALGDHPTLVAAHAARRLGLRGNPVAAVEHCATKLRQRQTLAAAGVPVPSFFDFRLGDPLEAILSRVRFPCVLKPLVLAASQGVIRADDAANFERALARIRSLVESPPVRAGHREGLDRLLVESYVPGREVAVEGLLVNGELRVLAIFDKPDPLEGPFFEETIYVTPSRLPVETQEAIRDGARRAVRAIGLTDGPLHAEFRVEADRPWVLEVQPRPIGGLCSRALRFGPARVGLEELLVRHALDIPGWQEEREPEASGVMMIPVPRSGILESVAGIKEVQATPGIVGLEITARLRDPLVAWPEGASYPGFLFARGESPAAVESALRTAHSRLRFEISEELPVEHPAANERLA